MKESSKKSSIQLTDLNPDLPIELLDDDQSSKFRGGTKKPYCSVASNKGAQYHVWGSSSFDTACGIASAKLIGLGYSIDRLWKSYYKPGLNQAELSCNQGTKKVYGTDTAVFENAINMKNQLGWNGCLIKVLQG